MGWGGSKTSESWRRNKVWGDDWFGHQLARNFGGSEQGGSAIEEGLLVGVRVLRCC